MSESSQWLSRNSQRSQVVEECTPKISHDCLRLPDLSCFTGKSCCGGTMLGLLAKAQCLQLSRARIVRSCLILHFRNGVSKRGCYMVCHSKWCEKDAIQVNLLRHGRVPGSFKVQLNPRSQHSNQRGNYFFLSNCGLIPFVARLLACSPCYARSHQELSLY